MKQTIKSGMADEFKKMVGRALRRSAQEARKMARLHGTPIYVWQDGKVIARKP